MRGGGPSGLVSSESTISGNSEYTDNDMAAVD